eukprot:3545600-Prorocentrum_lima.AAC.1
MGSDRCKGVNHWERRVLPEDAGGHQHELPIHEQSVVDPVPVQSLEALFKGQAHRRSERPLSNDL